MGYWGFPKYVSVGEKRVKAQKKLKKLRKKNPGIKPIIIEGKDIAKTWWGKEWNKNLEPGLQKRADAHRRPRDYGESPRPTSY